MIPGSRKAVIVLKCLCKVDTQKAMRIFRAQKKETRICALHGEQGILRVESERW